MKPGSFPTWRPSMALLVLAAAAIVVSAPAAAPERKLPRIVAGVMLDTDGDSRTDRVRLTYSMRVRHSADRDGKYPFVVSGYRIRSIGAARGKQLAIVLVEKRVADPKAKPSVRYKRTRAKPVRDRAGNEAAAQLFRRIRAHGRVPVAGRPPTAPPPSPTPADRDGDGILDAQDCAPENAAIKPGAADAPDLAFVDANCDGIDGDEKKAIFASPLGNDANPGTKPKPKRQIQAAVTAAALAGKDVYAAAGAYGHVQVGQGRLRCADRARRPRSSAQAGRDSTLCASSRRCRPGEEYRARESAIRSRCDARDRRPHAGGDRERQPAPATATSENAVVYWSGGAEVAPGAGGASAREQHPARDDRAHGATYDAVAALGRADLEPFATSVTATPAAPEASADAAVAQAARGFLVAGVPALAAARPVGLRHLHGVDHGRSREGRRQGRWHRRRPGHTTCCRARARSSSPR